MKNFDTVGKSIKNMTKKAEKPMLKNVPVQNYAALKLASFPGRAVTTISKSANTKYFDTVEKSIKKVTENVEKPMPKMYLPNVETLTLVLFPNLVPRVFWLFKLKAKIPWERDWSFPESPTKIP